MNKICTDIEQSLKLIELGIDIDTADMCYINGKPNIGFLSEEYKMFGDNVLAGYWPAWSLTSLMKLMPKVSTDGDEIYESYPIMEHDDEGFAVSSPIYNTSYYSEPIDAAVEMVVWLKENRKI